MLLTGASGLLGAWLIRTAPPGVDLVALTHRTPMPGTTSVAADLRDRTAVVEAVEQARPALVIHAAMAVDEVSIVGATRHVVDAAAAVGADVLHISTDAVFPGDGRPVAEDDVPDPIWDYGRWKAQAETMVLAGSPDSGNVRLPLLSSLEPLDHSARRLHDGAAAGETTTWFDDERRQPARASDLAEAVWRIAALGPSERSGHWHLAGPERLSRYEIAQRVVGALGLDPACIAASSTPAGAERPRDIQMLDERARAAIGWDPAPILT